MFRRTDSGATRDSRDDNKVLRVLARLIKIMRVNSEGNSTHLR